MGAAHVRNENFESVNVFKLFLPALFPSWRFFDVIAPSPRIELALLDSPEADCDVWRECRPRPARIGLRERLKALFWNAKWNESLFLVTCAERLVQNPAGPHNREIRRRVRAVLLRESGDLPVSPFFRFRLVFVSRHEDRLRRDVAFVSPPYPSVDPLDQ